MVDLRNKIEDTCRIARDNLGKAAAKQAKYFNKKMKARKFNVSDKVLILLPNKANKLQMTWKGPYIVTDKVNDYDYKVNVGDTERLYHANILKKYVERIPTTETHIIAVVMFEDKEESGIPSSNTSMIPLIQLQKTEGPEEVHIANEISPSEKAALLCEVRKRKAVLTDLPGRTHIQSCKIPQETESPVFVRQYPLPYAKVQAIGKEVDDMLAMGIIEPAASPYSAPVVLIHTKKEDGSNRFCIDYRKLNPTTRFDAEPMPDVNQLFAKLSNNKYFSKLDLCKGYWQIPMVESDKEKTAFMTPQGQFQWTVMPFGLKNAGAVFSRMMRKLLRPRLREQLHGRQHDCHGHLGTTPQNSFRSFRSVGKEQPHSKTIEMLHWLQEFVFPWTRNQFRHHSARG